MYWNKRLHHSLNEKVKTGFVCFTDGVSPRPVFTDDGHRTVDISVCRP